MTRLVVVQEQFGDVIAEAGGELHVGLYTRTAAMDDLPARIAEAEAAFEQHDFLRRIFPFTTRRGPCCAGFRRAAPAQDCPRTPGKAAADAPQDAAHRVVIAPGRPRPVRRRCRTCWRRCCRRRTRAT
jgi:hypothetical protein